MDLLTSISSSDVLLRALVRSVNKYERPRYSNELLSNPRIALGELQKALRASNYAFRYRAWTNKKQIFAQTDDLWPSRQVVESKERGLISLTFHDRVVQNAMVNCIKEKVIQDMQNDVSFGGKKIPGESAKSVQAMVARISDARKSAQSTVLRIDIRKFFPSIDQERLLLELSSFLKDSSAEWLFRAYLNGELVFDPQVTEEQRSALWYQGRGVPQGTLIAPLLSSFYLRDFDESLSTDGLVAFRYVDDLVVVCGGRDAEHLYWRLKARLFDEYGLDIPELSDKKDAKCRIYNPTETVDVVGFSVTAQGWIRPIQTGEDSIVRRIIEKFVDENERPVGGFCKSCYTTSQMISNWYNVYASVVQSKRYWSAFDKRVAFCLRRILDMHAELIPVRLRSDRDKLFEFLGVPRTTLLAASNLSRLSEAQILVLLQGEYEAGSFESHSGIGLR